MSKATAAPTPSQYWEKHDFPTVTMSEATKILELSLKYKVKRAVILLVSDAGVGKSQLVHQMADAHEADVVDIRTASFSQLSAGIPMRGEESSDGAFFGIAVPRNMPRSNQRRKILFFDEVNQGEKPAINMIFRLLEDRKLHDYTLPDDTVIVMAMNPAQGGYAVSKLEANPALNRRVAKYYVSPTYEDFMRHARTNKFHKTDGFNSPCHPAVLNYLERATSALTAREARDNGKQFTCPATWQSVSLICYNHEAEGLELDSDFTSVRIAGIIGSLQTQPFIQFLRNNNVLISPREVLTKYTANSAIRQRVVRVMQRPEDTEGAIGQLNQLLRDIMHLMLSDKMEPADIAGNMARFFKDICEYRPERAEQFFSELHNAHTDVSDSLHLNRNDTMLYVRKLTAALSEIPEWVETQESFVQNSRGYERKLQRSTDQTFDPMA